jgi:hypothetical protein
MFCSLVDEDLEKLYFQHAKRITYQDFVECNMQNKQHLMDIIFQNKTAFFSCFTDILQKINGKKNLLMFPLYSITGSQWTTSTTTPQWHYYNR